MLIVFQRGMRARAGHEHVADDAQRRAHAADPFLLRDELLEHVVLDRAAQLSAAMPRRSAATT
jgi:hypothetical protein